MNDKEIKKAIWYTITGSPKMEFLEYNNKLYISVDDAAATVINFRFKLLRMGLGKLRGLKTEGILELFNILSENFRAICRLKKTHGDK